MSLTELRERKAKDPIKGELACEIARMTSLSLDAVAKYWLDVDAFEAIEAHAYNMSPADKRAARRIIFEQYDYIVSQWNEFQERKNG